MFPSSLFVSFFLRARIISSKREPLRRKNWSNILLPLLRLVPNLCFMFSAFLPCFDHTSMLHYLFSLVWVVVVESWILCLFYLVSVSWTVKANEMVYFFSCFFFLIKSSSASLSNYVVHFTSVNAFCINATILSSSSLSLFNGPEETAMHKIKLVQFLHESYFIYFF